MIAKCLPIILIQITSYLQVDGTLYHSSHVAVSSCHLVISHVKVYNTYSKYTGRDRITNFDRSFSSSLNLPIPMYNRLKFENYYYLPCSFSITSPKYSLNHRDNFIKQSNTSLTSFHVVTCCYLLFSR